MSDPPPSSSAREHRERASRSGPVPVAVVTVSDSRTEATDESGRYLRDAIGEAGERLAGYRIVPDDPERVAAALDELASGEARVIIFNGGTGVSSRDTTSDVLSRKMEKTLPGFGELFRMLSYGEVGAAAFLSRAVAGVYRGRAVFVLPGSPAAVRLAWAKLLAPELRHLAREIGK
jgi:molybdenum cofactor biosynthesis protein B